MDGRLLLSLNGAALVLLLVVVCTWGRHRGRRAIAAIGLLGALGLAGVYFTCVGRGDLPTAWLTVLHFGSGETNIRHLYAHGAHSGPNWPLVLEVVAGDTRLTLRDAVRTNLGLAIVNGVAFFSIAAAVQGVRWAIPWTLVWSVNPAMFLASFSELPSNLLHLYLLCGVVAWATLNDTTRQPRWAKAAALLLLVVLTLLVASTRIEMGGVGAVALAVWGMTVAVGERTRAAWLVHVRRVLPGAVAFLSRHPALIALCCLAGWLISMEAGCGNDRLRWALSALYPFNPHFVLAFVVLPVLGLPVAVAIAALAGTAHATFHFRHFGGLPLALVVLARLYYAAPSGFYEVVRYTSYFLGLVFVLALFGRAAFDEFARRRAWPDSWRQLATIAYVMTWFTLPVLGTLDPYSRPEYDRQRGVIEQILLDRNTQREVRFLVDQTERHPDCVFVARVIAGHAYPGREPAWNYVLFGKTIGGPISVPEGAAMLEAAIAQHAGGAPCVRLYRGDDCNLTFTDGCRDFVAGREVVDELRFWSQPYNNMLDRGFGAPEIVLATYRWK
jgi:hypothetical protein